MAALARAGAERTSEVGDEVKHAPGQLAAVSDMRASVLWLRTGVLREWPADELEAQTVFRTRAQRTMAGGRR